MPLCSGSRLLLVLAAILTLVAGCGAPAPEAGPAGDARERLGASEGGQTILRAIEAHGGLDAWYNAPTSSYWWEYSNTGSNVRFKSHLVADNRTRLVYHDLVELGTPDSVAPITARFAWNGEVAWMYPDSVSQPNPMFWATTGYYFQSIPFVLADPGLRYEVLPVDTLDGRPYDMVRVAYDAGVGYSDGDTYTLYVDQETDMVRAIRYTVTYGRGRPDPASPSRETLFYYDDYERVDGLMMATHFRGYRFEDGGAGAARNEAWAGGFSFTQPFDAGRLAVPDGARVVPPPGS